MSDSGASAPHADVVPGVTLGPADARRPGLPEWLPSAGALLATLALVVLAAHALLSRDWSGLLELRGSSTPETPDAGMAEEALTRVERMPPAGGQVNSLGREMPKQPFPNQRRPPCDADTEIAVLGACWSVLKKEAPCGPVAYDFEGKCLKASYDAPRQPTSDEPR